MQIKEITEARMSPSTFDVAIEQGQTKGVLVGFEFEVCVPESLIGSNLSAENNGDKFLASAQKLKPIIEQTYKLPVHIFRKRHEFKKNLTDWYIEPDPSIEPTNPDDGYAEIVSPPMDPEKALQALQSFYAIANNLKLYTNSTTGLHINVSIPEKLDLLKLAVFLGDEYVLQQFNRQNSPAAVSTGSALKHQGPIWAGDKQPYNLKELQRLAKAHTSSHAASINNTGKYISFRHAGDNYLADLPKITNTIGRFIRAMLIASDPKAYENEYRKKLVQLVRPETNVTDVSKQLRTTGAPKYTISIFLVRNSKIANALKHISVLQPTKIFNFTNIESNSEVAKQNILSSINPGYKNFLNNIKSSPISKFYTVTVLPTTKEAISYMNAYKNGAITGILGNGIFYGDALVRKSNLSPSDPENIKLLKTVLRQDYGVKQKTKQTEQVELDERKRKRKKKTARYYYGPAYYFGATDTGAEGGDGGGLEEDWKKSLANVGLAGAIGLGAVGGLELKDKIKSVFTKPTAQTTQPVQAKSQQVQVSPITNNPLETYLMNVAKKSGLTGIELAQFLGQCAHETMDYKRMIERGAKKYFNKYEPKFAPGKAKLLGNVKPGDGERYKGRGYIQLTGRYNYKTAGKALNLPLEQNPELAAQPEIAAQIALWYWGQRVKPEVQNFADTTSVTRKINPGLSGLEDRHENFLSYIAQRDD